MQQRSKSLKSCGAPDLQQRSKSLKSRGAPESQQRSYQQRREYKNKMISVVYTAVCEGIEGIPVQVETDIGPGLPQINIVGLASTTVMESRERIKSGLLNSGFEYPRRRVTVNLIPAGIRKNGSHLDLAIAMGILGAMGYADADALREIGFIGEISLQGDVCRVEGVLPMILGMEKAGIRRVVLPAENLAEAELARESGSAGPELLAVRNLQECLDAVQGKKIPSQGERVRPAIRETEYADFSDISGQENAKRAAVIAVAGHHGLLMMGSPGCGKTMIARRIPSILPPLTRQQMVETTIIYSIAGKLEKGQEIISMPPFRRPHHSIGKAGLLGGGSYPVPGEITMAHNGSLITAQFAGEQGRTVYAVPGNINSQFSIGTNLLIRDGAVPLVVVKDVLLDMGLELPEESEKKIALGGDETAILEIVKRNNGIHVNEIAHIMNKNIGKISAIITVLEIKGIVISHGGKIHLAN